ncbi:hypothetical protein Tco_1464156 [Tanacetum coccineum]
MGIAVSAPLGLRYGTLRRQELALEEDQTPPSPEWTSGLLPISPSPSVILSLISSRMIPLTIPSPVATPAITETKGFLTELGAQVGAVKDEIFSQRYRFRSLEYEQEQVAVTFEAIWRPVLALDS